MNITDTDITVHFTVQADQIEPGDQIIVEGDLFIVHSVDADRDDIDEVLVKGENLTNIDETEFVLFADDEFEVWSI